MAKGVIRRGQIVDTYGVGSLLDVNGEGFIVLDTSHWPSSQMVAIDMPRLSAAVGNKRLLTFGGSKASIPVERFPKWYFCSRSNCRRLVKVIDEKFFQKAEGDDSNLPTTPSCPDCNDQMTPMRWIAYCDKGHLAEVDWSNWCHGDQEPGTSGQCERSSRKLKYIVKGDRGGDFDQLFVQCSSCGHERSLEGIKSKHKLRGAYVNAYQGKKCCDSQPWELFNKDKEYQCDEVMSIEPRGSAALYRSKKLSALALDDTTGDSEGLSPLAITELEKAFANMQTQAPSTDQFRHELFSDDTSQTQMRIQIISEHIGVELEDALIFLRSRFREAIDGVYETSASSVDEQSQQDLLMAEFQMFRNGKDIANSDLNVEFWVPKPEKSLILSRLFRSVGSVRKLREVRALLGFTRGKHLEAVSADLSTGENWVPAVEAWGEGIYLELNSEFLNKWSSANEKLFEPLITRQLANISASDPAKELGIYPDVYFLVAHTLSHLLIRQLTFESGYSSSALRERLYFDESTRQVGILIYTSDSDSEGTLGGLVEQAFEEKLEHILNAVANSSRWCSLDPVCRETEQQGIGGLNSASCHSCSLVSETSCTYQNAGLSRLLLGGLGDSNEELMGVFEYIFRDNTN